MAGGARQQAECQGRSARFLALPEITPFAQAREPIPYSITLAGSRPGPHVVLSVLVHGNELGGAHALIALLGAGVRPSRGRLTLLIANPGAFQRFDFAEPHTARFVDEDLNRVWSDATLDGPRQSLELARARAIRPLIRSADFLLDLHSTSQPSPPLLLAGRTAKARRFARQLGYPADIVVDQGHEAGPRLRDYGRFDQEDDPAIALLVECGQNLEAASASVALTVVLRFLRTLGLLESPSLPLPEATPEGAQRLLIVTHTLTARSNRFTFVKPLSGLETIDQADSLIGYDDGTPVRTPYDSCVLIMPNAAPLRGQTAVRLARVAPNAID